MTNIFRFLRFNWNHIYIDANECIISHCTPQDLVPVYHIRLNISSFNRNTFFLGVFLLFFGSSLPRYQTQIRREKKTGLITVMLYTLENVYIQPINNNQFFYQVITSQPSIVYIQPAVPSYTYTSSIPSRHVLPSTPVETKTVSQEFIVKEPPKSSTPLTADAQLDLNLSRYGYRRELVNGDGNCFFTAIACQLIRLFIDDRSFRQAIKQRLNLPENLFTNSTQLARTLRKLICLEWKINPNKYKPYINDVNYSDEIRKFRSDKFYSSILGDILPLTMSNLIGIHLKIITNLRQCPVIDICPQDEPLLAMKSIPVLTLAYNQENEGHYDIAIKSEI